MPTTRRSLQLLAWSVVISGSASAMSIPWLAAVMFAELHAAPTLAAVVSVLSAAGVLIAVPAARRLAKANARVTTIALLAGFRLAPGCALAVWWFREALGAAAAPLLAAALLLCALCAGALAGPHDTWFQRVIPRRLIGRFLGWRTGVSTLIAGGTCLAAGVAMEWHGAAMLVPILVFALFFGYAEMPVLLAVGDGHQPVPPADTTAPVDPRYRRLGWQIARSGTAPNLVAPWILPGLGALGLGAGGVTLVAAAQILGSAGGMIAGGRGTSMARIRGQTWIRAAALAGLALCAWSGNLELLVVAGLVAIEAAAAGAWSADTTQLCFIAVNDGDPRGFAIIKTVSALAAGIAGLLGTLLGSLWPGPCLAPLALVAAVATAVSVIPSIRSWRTETT